MTTETMSLEEALNASLADAGDDFSMSSDKSAAEAIKPEESEDQAATADSDDAPADDKVEGESEEAADETADAETDEEGDDKPDEPDGDDDEDATPQLSEDEQRQTTKWSKEHKELYASLTPEARGLMMDRFKDAERRVTQATTEASEIKRQYAELEEVYAPIDVALVEKGTNRAEYTRNIFNYAQLLAKNPRVGIAALMKAEGVSLEDMEQAIAAGEIDKGVAAFNQEIATKQAYDKGRQQASQATQAQTLIGEFAATKDEAGNPAYPHFDAVREKMARVIATFPKNDTRSAQEQLRAAYEDAVWTSPELRQSEVEKIASERAAKARETEARAKTEQVKADRAKAEKARRAAGVNSSATSPAKTGQSTADDLDSLVREQMSALGMT